MGADQTNKLSQASKRWLSGKPDNQRRNTECRLSVLTAPFLLHRNLLHWKKMTQLHVECVSHEGKWYNLTGTVIKTAYFVILPLSFLSKSVDNNQIPGTTLVSVFLFILSRICFCSTVKSEVHGIWLFAAWIAADVNVSGHIIPDFHFVNHNAWNSVWELPRL